jgi:hypothetical protein
VDAPTADERAAYVLNFFRELDDGGWHRVESGTREVMSLRRVRRAIRDVSGELLDFGALPGQRVEALVRAALAAPW